MTNPQGTQWESAIVREAQESGAFSGRHPKRGQKGEPDVWIETAGWAGTLPVVMWKRLVGRKADGRRKPDGEPAVVVIGFSDFMKMLPFLPFDFQVQAKWTSTLNVTRTLADLRAWMKANL